MQILMRFWVAGMELPYARFLLMPPNDAMSVLFQTGKKTALPHPAKTVKIDRISQHYSTLYKK